MAVINICTLSLVFLSTATVFFAGKAHGSDVCLKADYVPLCRSVVKNTVDPIEATKVAIEHLIFETKRAKEASAKLGKSQTIGICKTNYNDAIDNLKKCEENLKSHDKSSLNINLSAALSAYATCDDAIAEVAEVASESHGESSIVTNDAMLRKLASNSLYLASLTA